MLNDKGDPKKEVSKRISECMAILNKMDPCWKHLENPTKWKLRIYDAVIKTKLLYGLESVQLNDSLKKRLDAFQLKGLRKILRMSTTFVDRANTNQTVYAHAEQQMNLGVDATSHKYKQIKKLSEAYETKRRMVTLGIIKQRNTNDPKIKITMQRDTLALTEYNKKRVGRPKNVWWHYALVELWQWIGLKKNSSYRNVELNMKNAQHIEELKHWSDVEDLAPNPTL